MISLTDQLSTSFSQYRCYMFNSVNHLCLTLLTGLNLSVADTLRSTHPPTRPLHYAANRSSKGQLLALLARGHPLVPGALSAWGHCRQEMPGIVVPWRQSSTACLTPGNLFTNIPAPLLSMGNSQTRSIYTGSQLGVSSSCPCYWLPSLSHVLFPPPTGIFWGYFPSKLIGFN